MTKKGEDCASMQQLYDAAAQLRQFIKDKGKFGMEGCCLATVMYVAACEEALDNGLEPGAVDFTHHTVLDAVVGRRQRSAGQA